MGGETKRLALIKDRDRYVFCYDEAGRKQLLETFRRYCEDESLDFDSLDAAVLGQQIDTVEARSSRPPV